MSEIGRVSGSEVARPASVVEGLAQFETTVRAELERAGLPSTDVFVALPERAILVQNVPGILAPLGPEVRGRSYYISKMIAAATVGLFDAALNYLWDELINEL